MAEREVFGRMPDGRAVERAVIQGGGLTAKVLSFGAVVQDLRLDGHAPPLVLGFEALDHYLAHSPYFGATVGRSANRIAGAKFALDGAEHNLDRNNLGKHHLHGGSRGIGVRLWTFDEVSLDSATLSIRLEDGEMGYPGAMRIEVRFHLGPGGVLDIRMTAETDRATLCNLAHHSYFNLDGSPDILGHYLTVAADRYLPVDAELIPTGETATVTGTPFDFRSGALLRDAGLGIDHNFCLSSDRVALRDVAELSAGDVRMRVKTTEPGLQVYDAAALDVPVPGLGGRRMGPHAGIALEPQVWPDAIHHPDWPQPLLRPGSLYVQHTQFVFTRRPG
ncbi:Aldose 1-epimerase [Defluviimonas aquaemixtae]|uniref:Aldose 1-epimerase n=1 Tax=Albidovulum aquaemixtae TaxID=1542388 RepID=A0A2R8B694_9RHOB|nr:aldose epimerase family protein [Defluviimonas aquaemixtae]SPH18171.1 Aldose 1-epimerase [Defluviimonas aquaemixtae]